MLSYLVRAPETEASVGQTIEICGPEILRYADLVQRYAKLRRLRRKLLFVPFLTPGLAAFPGLIRGIARRAEAQARVEGGG